MGSIYTDPKSIKAAKTTWYSANIKDDGVAYIDPKTRARKFDMTKFAESFNPQRQLAISMGDALIDPTITIRHEEQLKKKDLRYQELGKRDTFQHDRETRVINDYTGKPMIKVDQEGGIFDQQLK